MTSIGNLARSMFQSNFPPRGQMSVSFFEHALFRQVLKTIKGKTTSLGGTPILRHTPIMACTEDPDFVLKFVWPIDPHKQSMPHVKVPARWGRNLPKFTKQSFARANAFTELRTPLSAGSFFPKTLQPFSLSFFMAL